MEMPEVAIVQYSLRRYREAFYEALRERLANAGIALRLVEAKPEGEGETRRTKADIGWAEQAPARFVGVAGRRLVWQSVLSRTREADLVIVEQASHLLANYPLLIRHWVRGAKVAYWGHGRQFDERRASRLGEALKRVTSRHVHWWFAYTDVSADVVAEFGFPRERITVVRNSTDTTRLRRLMDATTASDVNRMSAEVGLNRGQVGLFLGSLQPNKHLDYLLTAADEIRAQVPDFELVIVGDGIERARVERMVSRRPWAHMAGPRFDHELAALLSAAAVILVPAWVGLVVVDSFAAGVPLVASSGFPHPPEISYLRHGFNGLMVDDAGDPTRYATEVVRALCDEGLRARLIAGCAETAGHLGTDQMAERFAEGIEQALMR